MTGLRKVGYPVVITSIFVEKTLFLGEPRLYLVVRVEDGQGTRDGFRINVQKEHRTFLDRALLYALKAALRASGITELRLPKKLGVPLDLPYPLEWKEE